MIINFKSITSIFFILTFTLVNVCAQPQTENSSTQLLLAQVIDGQCENSLSENEKYCATLKSEVKPIPLNKIHGWILHVENRQGQIVENAKIMVYGGMPAHKHGFPTNPRVTKYMGNGDYFVDGVKFSMPGEWEFWFIISSADLKDKVRFSVNLP